MINVEMLRGNTEAIILKQLLARDKYGYEISKSIFELTDGALDMKDATLYTAFRRMQEEGLITPYWGDGELGARRRYYTITEKGREFYTLKKEEYERTVSVLSSVLIGGDQND